MRGVQWEQPTEQQQLHLPGGLLSVFAQVPVNHLTPLHRRLVLGADRAAHRPFIIPLKQCVEVINSLPPAGCILHCTSQHGFSWEKRC